MSSSALFNAIAPVYADDPRADTFLTLAAQNNDPSVFGNVFEEAMCWYAASMMWNSPADLGVAQNRVEHADRGRQVDAHDVVPDRRCSA